MTTTMTLSLIKQEKNQNPSKSEVNDCTAISLSRLWYYGLYTEVRYFYDLSLGLHSLAQ